MLLHTRAHRIDNHRGWTLQIHQSTRPGRLDPTRPPVVILPGYGMNDAIFRHHPTGRSLVGALCDDGLEVWSVNLRGQGGGFAHGDAPSPVSLTNLALEDLPAAFDAVLQLTHTHAEQIDLMGCSLGCALAYGYLAHHPDDHVLRAMVAIAGPLRWIGVHPLLRLAGRVPQLIGAVPFRGTRALAGRVLPVAQLFPALLRPYLTADRVDLRDAQRLVQTVEDPHPAINREIAEWVRDRDLIIGDLNVAEALGQIHLPLLCVVGNADGIVPPNAAKSIVQAMPEGCVEVLEIGDKHHPYAHADLFISDGAQHTVFRPIRRWLAEHTPPDPTNH